MMSDSSSTGAVTGGMTKGRRATAPRSSPSEDAEAETFFLEWERGLAGPLAASTSPLPALEEGARGTVGAPADLSLSLSDLTAAETTKWEGSSGRPSDVVRTKRFGPAAAAAGLGLTGVEGGVAVVAVVWDRERRGSGKLDREVQTGENGARSGRKGVKEKERTRGATAHGVCSDARVGNTSFAVPLPGRPGGTQTRGKSANQRK